MPTKEKIRRQQLLQHAEGYLELGLPRQALAALLRLDDPEAADRTAFHLWGEALRQLERYDEALAWLKKASDLAPDDFHIWLAQGWCYKRTGHLTLAIDALENALADHPSEAIIHFNLACYWSLAGNKRQALNYLAEAFEIDCQYRDQVHDEPDFDPIRNDPDFQSLTSVIV